MLTFVVADLHGRYDLLLACIGSIKGHLAYRGISPDERTRVVFLGDYVDRGPDSFRVVSRLMQGAPEGYNWDWVCLKGNHEQFMLNAADGANPSDWLKYGGKETLKSYEAATYAVSMGHANWMRSLPSIFWDEQRVYVHATVNEAYPLAKQREQDLLWNRYAPGENRGYYDLHVVHGHTPVPSGPERLPKRTNLDIGGVFISRMAIGVFDETQGPPLTIIKVSCK